MRLIKSIKCYNQYTFYIGSFLLFPKGFYWITKMVTFNKDKLDNAHYTPSRELLEPNQLSAVLIPFPLPQTLMRGLSVSSSDILKTVTAIIHLISQNDTLSLSISTPLLFVPKHTGKMCALTWGNPLPPKSTPFELYELERRKKWRCCGKALQDPWPENRTLSPKDEFVVYSATCFAETEC